MSGGWQSLPNGLPNVVSPPKSGHRRAAKGMEFPWRCNVDTIAMDLKVSWKRRMKMIWDGRRDWPSWESVVWKISLVGAIIWAALRISVAFLVKPDGYIDVSTLKCEVVIIRDDSGQSFANALGCPGERIYQCTRMSGTICASQLKNWAENQAESNSGLLFEHIVSVLLGTFGLLITYFVTLGAILALTDRFRKGNGN